MNISLVIRYCDFLGAVRTPENFRRISVDDMCTFVVVEISFVIRYCVFLGAVRAPENSRFRFDWIDDCLSTDISSYLSTILSSDISTICRYIRMYRRINDDMYVVLTTIYRRIYRRYIRISVLSVICIYDDMQNRRRHAFVHVFVHFYTCWSWWIAPW